MGPHWHVPLSNLRYFVAIPPFMMHDSWLFNSFYPFHECFAESISLESQS